MFFFGQVGLAPSAGLEMFSKRGEEGGLWVFGFISASGAVRG